VDYFVDNNVSVASRLNYVYNSCNNGLLIQVVSSNRLY